jgi:hypothetical protein
MRGIQDHSARIFCVSTIVLGAFIALRIRFDETGEREFYPSFVAFQPTFSVADFPAMRTRGLWGDHPKTTLVGCIAHMLSLLSINYVWRLRFAIWTAGSGRTMIPGGHGLQSMALQVRDVPFPLSEEPPLIKFISKCRNDLAGVWFVLDICMLTRFDDRVTHVLRESKNLLFSRSPFAHSAAEKKRCPIDALRSMSRSRCPHS